MALSDKEIFESYLNGYSLDNPKALFDQCMALSLLRHTGELNYIINTVSGVLNTKNWKQAESKLFPLS